MTRREGKPARVEGQRTRRNRAPAPEEPTLDTTVEIKYHAAFRELSTERVRQLTDTILAQDDDEQARAFVELVAALAYPEEFGKRDELATEAIRHAFNLTMECSRAEDDFCLSIPRE